MAGVTGVLLDHADRIQCRLGNAGVNVASRTGFAMGRIGAFPHALARVHSRHRSPVVAIVVTFVLTVSVTLGLGLACNPTNAFAMVGTGIVLVLVARVHRGQRGPASGTSLRLIYLYVRDPRRVTEVGLVHTDAPELETVAEAGRLPGRTGFAQGA